MTVCDEAGPGPRRLGDLPFRLEMTGAERQDMGDDGVRVWDQERSGSAVSGRAGSAFSVTCEESASMGQALPRLADVRQAFACSAFPGRVLSLGASAAGKLMAREKGG